MVGRTVIGVMIVVAAALAVSRAVRETGSKAVGRWSATNRHSDVPADDCVDLGKINGPRVGWVFGQLVGAETPGLAPTRKETRERLIHGHAGLRCAVSLERVQ